MKNKLITDKSFYTTYIRLSLILMAEQAIILSVNLLDNVMIGAYSENALAGVAIINQLQFMLQSIATSFVSGVQVLGSQYWGKKDKDSIERLSSTGLFTVLGISAILFALVSIIPGPIIGIFTKDAAVAAEALKYLRIIRFSYPVFMVTMLLTGTFKCVGITRIALYLSGISLVVNLSLNYTLIFGRFGAPEMGSSGAALATLIARCTELLVILVFAFIIDKRLLLKPGKLLKPAFDNFGKYLRVVVPILIAAISFAVSNSAAAAILGHLSKNALAANSISTTLYQLVKVMAVGASNAAQITMGQIVGRGNKEEAFKACSSLQIVFVGIGVVVALILAIARIPVLSLYNVSPETYALANKFLMLLCVIGFFMSYQMPTGCGVVRGGGDVKYVMYLDLISIWLIVIPLSLLAAFVFRWSELTILLCLNSDQIFKCIPGFIKANRHKWYKDLT